MNDHMSNAKLFGIMLLIGALVGFCFGCASTGLDYDFHGRPYTVRVENNYGYGVHIYWVVSGAINRSAAARIQPKSEDVIIIPEYLQKEARIKILVCNGSLTPQTHCTIASGEVRPNGIVGNILTIQNFSYLTASIN